MCFTGVDGFDLIVEIVQNKHRIALLLASHQQRYTNPSTTTTTTTTVPFKPISIDETETANQRKKREQREDRELQAALQSSLADRSMDPNAPYATGTKETQQPDWLRQLGFDDEYLMVERSLGLQKGGMSSRARPENWLDDLAPEGERGLAIELMRRLFLSMDMLSCD